ncbi:hypothetical protein [Amycolatopsis keratiniphila]|uniref:hypothetical protein n=1 Tax=Amycolatopsis keratiniphila TaxID=129921 RepID=UPI000907D01A|nr:hypothetical protein [Amycolatopsis keratiniphila]OLZ50276.1 hypothetical protein BS330_28840 [Amycolatopsis keratiniphila subsp. nogabecina]
MFESEFEVDSVAVLLALFDTQGKLLDLESAGEATPFGLGEFADLEVPGEPPVFFSPHEQGYPVVVRDLFDGFRRVEVGECLGRVEV